MKQSITAKILGSHLVGNKTDINSIPAGAEIALRIDQTLTQDATGTMAYLQFEATGVQRVATDLSVSYVDHNTLQMGFRNPDDHQYLRTVAQKYGIVFSPAGTGICHQLHLENFAKPGATLLGSDSHTPTAGGMGSLAMGAGGLSVALAMAGEAYTINKPEIVQVWCENSLQGWASAKDIILYLLGLLTVKGGVGKVFEFAGPGVATLSVPERAVITNMGAELGATTSIFPSDAATKDFLTRMGRAQDWKALEADVDAVYDEVIRIDLSAIVPLAACPHMPDRVVTVAALAGVHVDQVAIGSCTNSSYIDLKQVSQILANKHVAFSTDTCLSPGSKQVLTMLAREGLLESLLNSGCRLLECACGPCIGMGGSPVSQGVSVRTFNRNFEGRSGTKDAQVYLVSPITAAFTALHGQFTDPVIWGKAPEKPTFPKDIPSIAHLFAYPPADGSKVSVARGPNIVPLERFAGLPEKLAVKVALCVGDNITTDHIMPAGAEITALRSNIPAIAEHVFSRVDENFVARAKEYKVAAIIAGENYGQGSSREHAALAPRHLGIQTVLACSFARIHRTNLVNFGIIPLLFVNKDDKKAISEGNTLALDITALEAGKPCSLLLNGTQSITVTNDLSAYELAVLRAGGLLNYIGQKKQ